MVGDTQIAHINGSASLLPALLDELNRIQQFLQAVIDTLALDTVTVLPERAELLGQLPQHRQQYDWAVARAVAELRVLVEYLLPLCRVGGKLLAQKGEGVQAEIANAVKAIKLLGGSTPELGQVILPNRELPHYFVVVEKLAETPDKYPRRVGVPGKRPL